MFTCEICLEHIHSPNKKFKNQNKCDHPYCQNCITQYIIAKLDYNMPEINCPAWNCGEYLDPISCKPMISTKVFDKWCDLLCESVVMKFDRCYCPYVDCSNVILNECDESVEQCQCPKCKRLFCFSCEDVWHAGFNCQQYRQVNQRHDVEFRVLAENKKWQRCPVCRHCVELVEGCNIVRCRCGTKFCYYCGMKVRRHWCKCNETPEALCVLFTNVLGYLAVFVFAIVIIEFIFRVIFQI